MKKSFAVTAMSFLLTISYCSVFAQDRVTVVAPTSEAGEGLDLNAVGELFKDSKDLEAFMALITT